MELRDYLAALRRHWVIWVGATLVGALAAVAVVAATPPDEDGGGTTGAGGSSCAGSEGAGSSLAGGASEVADVGGAAVSSGSWSLEVPSNTPSTPRRAMTATPTATHAPRRRPWRAAGAAPVSVGDPGYGRHLDRDGDGIGCE